MTALSFFTVDGHWWSGDAPDYRGTSGHPVLAPVTGYVDFIPRVPKGFSIRMDSLTVNGTTADSDFLFPARTARIWDGRLCTINQTDTPTIQLLANTPALNLAEQLPETNGALIYDVRFRDVRFNNAAQVLANFAFEAPTSAATLSITDETLVRLPYGGPTKAR